MIAYCGETRARKTLAALDAAGIGTVIQRGRYKRPPPRSWVYDNAVFEDHRNGRAFDGDTWIAELPRVLEAERAPDFVVIPDMVASADSLAFSLSWLPRVPRSTVPLALVVQNGMKPDAIPWDARFDVVFVGGSVDWKLRTGGAWAAAAHAHGKRCHVGRVGSMKRVSWAHAAGADSIDSSLPLWSAEMLERFVRSLNAARQQLPLF